MTDLATRLEAGPGSRELSNAVLLALGFRYFPESDEWAPVNGWLIAICPTELASDPARSVDDGLALLQEMGLRLQKIESRGKRSFYVVLHAPDPNNLDNEGRPWQPWACGFDLACVICAALVRAKGQESSDA